MALPEDMSLDYVVSVLGATHKVQPMLVESQDQAPLVNLSTPDAAEAQLGRAVRTLNMALIRHLAGIHGLASSGASAPQEPGLARSCWQRDAGPAQRSALHTACGLQFSSGTSCRGT